MLRVQADVFPEGLAEYRESRAAGTDDGHAQAGRGWAGCEAVFAGTEGLV